VGAGVGVGVAVPSGVGVGIGAGVGVPATTGAGVGVGVAVGTGVGVVGPDGVGVPDTAFSEVIAEVEEILKNPDATKAELEHAKKLAEAVNKHDKDNPECETGTGSKSNTGIKTGKKGTK